MLRRSVPSIAWAAALGLSVTVLRIVGACVPEDSGLGGLGGGDAGGDHPDIPCQTAAQCDDMDPCTTDACGSEGVCTWTPVVDGPAPPSAQMKGTCQRIVCKGGNASTIADDTNVPAAPDMCTSVSCSGGKPQMMPQPDGTQCTLAGSAGTCTAGKCTVACMTTSMCPSKGSCQTASCDGSKGVCVYQNVADGTLTPGATQPKGDCHTHACLSGADINVVDDSDVPAPMSDCDDASCNNGSPVHSFTNHPLGSPCSTFMVNMANKPGFCDGKGSCVGCTMDSQCPGTTNDCGHPTCGTSGSNLGICSMTLTSAGTATTANPAQIQGDCHTIVCDGSGGNTNKIDDTDVPASGTVCITNHCANGTVTAPTINTGMACGGAQACNAQGQCPCTTDAQCQPPSYEKCGGGGMPGVCGCTPTTCVAKGLTCGSAPDGCGGTLNCNDGKTDSAETDVDCGGATSSCATRCAQGRKCTMNTDCASGFCADGVCCNMACTGSVCQACSAVAKGQGTDGVCGAVVTGGDPHNDCTAQAVSTCGRMGGCNGAGACAKWPDGTACSGTSCKDMSTQNNPKVCIGGACTSPAVQTLACVPYACVGSVTGACATSCGTKAYTDTDCSTGYYCDGTGAGICQSKRAPGGSCTNNDQCVSAVCLGSGLCQ